MNNSEYALPKVWAASGGNGGKWAGVNRANAGPTHDMALDLGEKPLQLYSLGTPNGIKITVLLEELLALGNTEAAYDLHTINIGKGEQFGSEFVKLNPNSKIPVLLDQSVTPALPIFESSAILLYLAEKHNAFLPTDPSERIKCLTWLFWQTGSAPFLGGGFGHFYKYAPIPMEYPIDRYTMEAKRQLDVLDRHLATSEYMCASGYSIADIAIWPWYGRVATGDVYDAAEFLGTAAYKNVLRWAAKIQARNAVQSGLSSAL